MGWAKSLGGQGAVGDVSCSSGIRIGSGTDVLRMQECFRARELKCKNWMGVETERVCCGLELVRLRPLSCGLVLFRVRVEFCGEEEVLTRPL